MIKNLKIGDLVSIIMCGGISTKGTYGIVVGFVCKHNDAKIRVLYCPDKVAIRRIIAFGSYGGTHNGQFLYLRENIDYYDVIL